MGKKRFKEKKYLKSGGGICPYCKSHDITTHGSPIFDANYVTQRVICDFCGSEWQDNYTLTGAVDIHNHT